MIPVIWNIVAEYASEYKFLEFINIDKIKWYWLSRNPNAIHILEKNLDKIDWNVLSANPNAIHLLENNLDKINWNMLSTNPSICKLNTTEIFDIFSS